MKYLTILLIALTGLTLRAQVPLDHINQLLAQKGSRQRQAVAEFNAGLGRSQPTGDLQDLAYLTAGRALGGGFSLRKRSFGWNLAFVDIRLPVQEEAPAVFLEGSQINFSEAAWRSQRLSTGPMVVIGGRWLQVTLNPRIALSNTSAPSVDVIYDADPNFPAQTLYTFSPPTEKMGLGYDLEGRLDLRLGRHFGLQLYATQHNTHAFSETTVRITEKEVGDVDGDGQITGADIVESPLTERAQPFTERLLTGGIRLTYRFGGGLRPRPRDDDFRPLDTLTQQLNPDCECGFVVFRNEDGNYQLRYGASCPAAGRYTPTEFFYSEIRNGNIPAPVRLDLSNSSGQRAYSN
ncbi:MAG: hypothetical protein KDC54_06125, partial [Lewinella sp.]|nr:hypothetical protein [Lewinella sp.]